MKFNVINILCVRMQNIDYKNNRNIGGAIVDMVKFDRFRMFYKGLVPITVASSNLITIPDIMHYFRDEKNFISCLAWPFLFFLGTLTVHPFFLIGIRT